MNLKPLQSKYQLIREGFSPGEQTLAKKLIDYVDPHTGRRLWIRDINEQGGTNNFIARGAQHAHHDLLAIIRQDPWGQENLDPETYPDAMPERTNSGAWELYMTLICKWIRLLDLWADSTTGPIYNDRRALKGKRPSEWAMPPAGMQSTGTSLNSVFLSGVLDKHIQQVRRNRILRQGSQETGIELDV